MSQARSTAEYSTQINGLIANYEKKLAKAENSLGTSEDDNHKIIVLNHVIDELRQLSTDQSDFKLASKKLENLYVYFIKELTVTDPTNQIEIERKYEKHSILGYKNSYLQDSFKKFGELALEIAAINQKQLQHTLHETSQNPNTLIQNLAAAITSTVLAEQIKTGYKSEDQTEKTKLVKSFTDGIYILNSSNPQNVIEGLQKCILKFLDGLENITQEKNEDRTFFKASRGKWNEIMFTQILPMITNVANKLGIDSKLLNPEIIEAKVEAKFLIKDIEEAKKALSKDPHPTLAWQIKRSEERLQNITEKYQINLEELKDKKILDRPVSSARTSTSKAVSRGSSLPNLSLHNITAPTAPHRSSMPTVLPSQQRSQIPMPTAAKETPNANSYKAARQAREATNTFSPK